MDLKFVKGNDNTAPEPELDVNAIPDLDKLLGDVLKILEYISTPDMIRLEESDAVKFEKHLENVYADFSDRHNSIFRLLLDKKNREQNILRLIQTFHILRNVKQGKLNIETADEKFKEGLNNEYLYPLFGGKEEYIKKMNK